MLADPRVEIYDCGRRDIETGEIDRRVLATLEFLSACGLKPTVTLAQLRPRLLHRVGQRLRALERQRGRHRRGQRHPDLGHQGAGSITDITIRRLLTLQGTMKPHQIISLMTYPGTDNTLALPDHADHIHVGFRPLSGNRCSAQQLDAILKPQQWTKLVERLGAIENPIVRARLEVRDQGRPRRDEAAPTGAGAALPLRAVRVPVGARARRTGATSCARTRRRPRTCSCSRRSGAPERRRLRGRRAGRRAGARPAPP